MSWANAIDAITLFVEDPMAAKDFYTKVFDLPVTFEDNDSVVFKFGSLLVNLLRVTATSDLIHPAVAAAPAAGNRFQLTIHVDNVDALCEKLAPLGVELLNGPVDRPWGPRTASFRDPAGHIWEVAS